MRRTTGITQQPSYGPSTRHLGKTMATLNTQDGEGRHGKREVRGRGDELQPLQDSQIYWVKAVPRCASISWKE